MNAHCWHHNGMTYTVNPPVHYETCCHCGTPRRVGAVYTSEGHGRFLKGPTLVEEVEEVGPCIDRSSETPT